jgi:cytochrome c-type biogenesis protein CcsB
MEWNNIQNVLSNIVFALLLIATIGYWINLTIIKSNFVSKVTKMTIIISNILLIFILGSRWIIEQYFPLSNLYESLLFLTWTLLSTYLYVEYKTKSKLIGAILIPICLLISGFSNLTLPLEMQKSSSLVPALQSNWLMMHVSMMMLSYSTLITGSLISILFLIISTIQKNNSTDFEDLKFDSFSDTKSNKLKLLESLDNWSYRIIGLGFPFLTIGIISGGVWANEAWGSYWSWDPKETWALITWLVFAAYLHARITKGWQGQKTAILASLGFLVIWICYLGVNFLGKGLHSYGWLN